MSKEANPLGETRAGITKRGKLVCTLAGVGLTAVGILTVVNALNEPPEPGCVVPVERGDSVDGLRDAVGGYKAHILGTDGQVKQPDMFGTIQPGEKLAVDGVQPEACAGLPNHDTLITGITE